MAVFSATSKMFDIKKLGAILENKRHNIKSFQRYYVRSRKLILLKLWGVYHKKVYFTATIVHFVSKM